MPLAIFGIDNTAISLAVTLVVLALLAIWIALIVFTFIDARRRISDQFLVGCSTAASFFPFVGTLVYTILRPAEFLDDVRERDIEMKSAETELRHLEANSCHKCGFATQPDFIRCPGCRTRLKEPCPSCDRPVGLKWKVCPYCEHTLIAAKRSSRRTQDSSRRKPAKPDRDETGDAHETPSASGDDRRAAPASDAGRPDEKAQPRARRATRRQSPDKSSPATSEKPQGGDRSKAPAAPSGTRRRRVTITDEEDTQVAHQPINGGDSSSSPREPDRG